MLTNEQMKRNRFGKWHDARKRIKFIIDNLNAGNIIVIATPLKATRYTKAHTGMFKATKSGAYVQRGKNWDCIDGCSIRAWKP